MSVNADLPRISFAASDCDLFARYPARIHWDDQSVPPVDQNAFRNIRKRLEGIAQWAVRDSPTNEPLTDFVSSPNPNGRTPKDMWCCVYPADAPDELSSPQVALIISEEGAELCLRFGSGTTELNDSDERTLRTRLESVPEPVIRAVETALPDGVRYLPAEPGSAGLRAWLTDAAGNLQASVSQSFSAEDLDGMGNGIAGAFLRMLEASAPLLDYCATGTVGDYEQPPTATFDFETLRSRSASPPHNLRIADDVYHALIAAVRSGKHVILTGPPGTAKTTLAEVLCGLAEEAGYCAGYTLTTATADWTTYETIGGLRPASGGSELRFHPGLFLESAGAGRWVIVDELNRSNFDRAFGQLFTVLSGQSVVLPYEDHQTGKRIIITTEATASPQLRDRYSVIEVPRDWRIIATMNVFDKSLLFEMSYALMRRFAFVEVPAPDASVYEDIWQRELVDLPVEEATRIGSVLAALEPLRSIKQIGPAVFRDMARFAREYPLNGSSDGAERLTYQLFYTFLLPQFEGIDQQDGRRLFEMLSGPVGAAQRDRLAATLRDVLNVTLDGATA